VIDAVALEVDDTLDSSFGSSTPGEFNSAQFPADSGNIIARLRLLASNLPESVAVGDSHDEFAISVEIHGFCHRRRGPWETFIDPMLIRYERDVSEVAKLIRRKEFGMDGFCRVSRSLELG
jgi:hypothetical protein